ncbi:Uncharacterised protein [Halioglobus japonicus]|nr:Uncharacterised protein [Halioglobus japonicus]
MPADQNHLKIIKLYRVAHISTFKHERNIKKPDTKIHSFAHIVWYTGGKPHNAPEIGPTDHV